MAEETIVRLIDDLDGGDATQKVLLGLNGEWRALDLNDGNHAALMDALRRFWDAGASVRGGGGGGGTGGGGQRRSPSASRSSSGGSSERGYDLGMLREWAAETGTKVPARGRISNAVVEQFQEAQRNGWQPKG